MSGGARAQLPAPAGVRPTARLGRRAAGAALALACSHPAAQAPERPTPSATPAGQSAVVGPSAGAEHTAPPPSGRTGAEAHMHRHGFDELVARFEAPSREQWQRPEALLDTLEPLAGVRAVDLGAGTGYFAFRLAKRGATVLATDLEPRFVDYLEARKAREPDGARVTARLVSADDPGLEPATYDLALIVDVYHHVSDRAPWLTNVRRGLRDHGRVVIVDFKPGDFPDAPPPHLRLPADTVLREVVEAGFTDVRVDADLLPRQYVVVGVEREPRSL